MFDSVAVNYFGLKKLICLDVRQEPLFPASESTFKIEKYRHAQPAITCSKLTIETLEKGVEYFQS